MSASMATTGRPWPARCRTNSDDTVVLALPPLPANAIFIRSLRVELVSGLSSRPAIAHLTGMIIIFM